MSDYPTDDMCQIMGRPFAQETDDGSKIELRTHSEKILLGEDDARQLADEIHRILESREPDDETENKED